jgi:hypothetical protein
MLYQIDQSGKIEDTAKDTVLGCANDSETALILRRQDKRMIQQIYRLAGHPRFFQYFVFSALLAILLKRVDPRKKVLLDREYPGYESLIEERTKFYLKLLGRKKNLHLTFGQIGKESSAHFLAHGIAIGRKSPTRVVKLEEILKLLLTTQKDRDPKTYGHRTA